MFVQPDNFFVIIHNFPIKNNAYNCLLIDNKTKTSASLNRIYLMYFADSSNALTKESYAANTVLFSFLNMT